MNIFAILSTLTACKTHSFQYFSFLFYIHSKQTRNYIVRQTWSPMAFLSLRETLPKTLQIHFFLCRWIFCISGPNRGKSFIHFALQISQASRTAQGLSSKTNMVPYDLLVTAGDTPQNTPNRLFSM